MKTNQNNAEELGEVITVNEAWKLLKVGKGTIYNLIKSKRLNAWKQGRIIRIRKNDLEKLFSGR